VALEISPLGERHHTGIANVTKRLAIELLSDETVDGRFFFNRSEIPQSIVKRLTEMERGDILWWLAARADFSASVPFPIRGSVVGIYSNHKWHRRLFPIEVQIVYDLTAIMAPQFHTEETIDFWETRLLDDMYSSDLIVAVSESTKADIRTYFPQLHDIPCIVAPLAPSTDHTVTFDDETAAEPYVLILGTLEPRKNVEIVFDVLTENREILDRYKFVFVGRWGWGTSAADMIENRGFTDTVERGRLVFTGFVSDRVRDRLIRHARCVLYPSHYEGFGLPILEALSFGTPVITGYGSSLPEAGGAVATYCDVKSVASFANALRSVLDSAESLSSAARARRRAWAAQFTWPATYRTIRDAAIALAARQHIAR
jgi:glycosyltransferase involved in cell wall biosynthesis